MAAWVHDSGLSDHLKSSDWSWLTTTNQKLPIIGRLPGLARIPGNFITFSVPIAMILFVRDRRQWKSAVYIFVCGVLAGCNALVKWVVGRARPYQGDVYAMHPFVGGIHGMGGANQSFPSGDVCLAAATGFGLMRLFPGCRIFPAAAIVLVAVERVAEGAHYPSDTIAAVGLGWLLAAVAWKVGGLKSSKV